MTAQARVDVNTTPFILYDYPASRRDNAVIAQDAGRAADLAPYTLMSQIAATGKWVPFTDETATNGTAIPRGIFVPSELQGAIAQADIVAGDVVDVPIITFGAKFDEGKLVIENSKTLDTIIATTTVNAKTVRQALEEQTLIPVNTRTASLPENS